jgi:hypothetical protein
MPQGWPKFTKNSFMVDTNDTLVAVLLTPVYVTTSLPISNTQVIVNVTTDYPFNDMVTFVIQNNKPFRFGIRIPLVLRMHACLSLCLPIYNYTPPTSPSMYVCVNHRGWATNSRVNGISAASGCIYYIDLPASSGTWLLYLPVHYLWNVFISMNVCMYVEVVHQQLTNWYCPCHLLIELLVGMVGVHLSKGYIHRENL